MVDRCLLQVLWKSGAAGGCSTGISHYRRGHLHETENMPCVWKGISSYNQPGILFRCLPGLCKTEIRAGTQTPEAAKPTMICPQLSLKSPWFSRAFCTCFQGSCIRILRCFEMRLSCRQNIYFNKNDRRRFFEYQHDYRGGPSPHAGYSALRRYVGALISCNSKEVFIRKSSWIALLPVAV